MRLTSAIIVAAGAGKRMNAPIPKQFIKIADKTILEHTINKFIQADFFHEILVVVSEDFLKLTNEIFSQEDYNNLNVRIITGGKERFHTVQNAVGALDKNVTTVFIHDAVRPFCSVKLLKELQIAATTYTGVIPAVELKDSIREVNKEGKSKSMDRSKFRSVQTPQVFDRCELEAAYKAEYSNIFTDDASVFEHAGNEIQLIEGENSNIKITTPEDLEIAKQTLVIS